MNSSNNENTNNYKENFFKIKEKNNEYKVKEKERSKKREKERKKKHNSEIHNIYMNE